MPESDKESPSAHRTPEETVVDLGDGRLFSALHHARRDGRPGPVVLIQTPYGKETLPASLFEGWEDLHVFVVDWRWNGGDQRHLSMIERARDGHDLVQWLSRAPFSDGRVAAWGTSALGAAVFRTAAAAPQALHCGVVLMAAPGWTWRDFHRGGVLRLEKVERLEALGFPVKEIIEGHPLEDAFWTWPVTPRLEAIRIPLLLQAGWFDLHLDRMIEAFADLRRLSHPSVRERHRLVIGPWTHHGTWTDRQGGRLFDGATAFLRGSARRWWRRHLHDEDGASHREEAPIHYWQPGEDKIRSAHAWPPAHARIRPFFPRSGSAAGLAETPGPEGRASFEHDPARPVPTLGGRNLTPRVPSGPRPLDGLEERPDVLTFTSEEVPEDLRAAGRFEMRVEVSSTTGDPHVAVLLADVDPSGRAVLVADGITRPALRSPAGPVAPLRADERRRVSIDLGNMAWTWLRGHRLRIHVAGSNHPRYETASEPCRTTIHFGGDAPTSLLLPVSP